jgi:transposase
MFGKDAIKLKSHRCGVLGKLFRMLKRHEAKGNLIVTTIDEYKTSKTCSFCQFDNMKIINTKNFKGSGVLVCNKCPKVWQRNVNIANNMMKISEAIWSGEGKPKVFKPKKKYRRNKHSFP